MTIEERGWPIDQEWQDLARAWNDSVRSRFPFAGIVPRDNVPSSGLTTKRWRMEVVPSIVLFKGLWLTQTGIEVMSLFGVPADHTADDPIPHVIRFDGRYYLEDGHSRVIRLAMGFATWTIARVLHVDKAKKVMLNNTDVTMMMNKVEFS